MRSFSPVQLATAISLVASVAAAFVPTFFQNLRASRLAEPLDGLNQIAGRATALAAGLPLTLAYPEPAPRTPARVPSGVRALDPEGTWDHPTWRQLDFRQEREHSFSFEFDSRADAQGATFVARALGDLDGDGDLSEFTISGEVRGTNEPVIYPLRLRREVE